MEPTQNPTTPPEPKKSFWAKLFGGGKSSSSPPPATPEQPTEPTSSDVLNSEPVPNAPVEAAIPPVPPATSTWGTTPVNSPVEQTTETPEPLPSPSQTEVPPVPSWRDTPRGEAEPLTEVPTPPSDPMVTPVQPAEPASYGQTVVPLDTVETPASTQEQPIENNPQNSPVSNQDNQDVDDRPSVTPPPAR